MEFSIIHPFWGKLYNIHFQATKVTNIHNLPNSSQIHIFDSKMNIILAGSWETLG